MTPVAIPVAVGATSWDVALAETLSGAAERTLSDGARGTVHSVHRRVVNVLLGDALVTIADDAIDDAPATIRVPLSDWDARGIRQNDPVITRHDRIELPCADDLRISLSGAPHWAAPRTDLQELTASEIVWALDILRTLPSPGPLTSFGRITDALVQRRIALLRTALRRNDDEAVRAAASALIGLGEGLTPSGDDVLTGLCLLAAQEGMLLSGALPALGDAIRAGRERTGLLSSTTMAHAVTGRGRQSLHDLFAALAARDEDALRHNADRILDIGHTSGADILSGIRLALDIEREMRSTGRMLRPSTTEQFAATKEIN